MKANWLPLQMIKPKGEPTVGWIVLSDSGARQSLHKQGQNTREEKSGAIHSIGLLELAERVRLFDENLLLGRAVGAVSPHSQERILQLGRAKPALCSQPS